MTGIEVQSGLPVLEVVLAHTESAFRDVDGARAISRVALGRAPDHHQPRTLANRSSLRAWGIAVAVVLAATGPASAQPAPVDVMPADGPATGAVRGDRGAPPGDTQALIASLRTRILAARSATLALEDWCAEHHLAVEPRLVALRLPVPDKPLSAARRARLAIGPDEPVRYRRVRLACGERVVSEADNWYVPGRLTPAMNAALDTTQTPFGRVVRSLDPIRHAVDQHTLFDREQAGADERLFEIDAVLTTGAGEPFCEVVETYLGGALPATLR